MKLSLLHTHDVQGFMGDGLRESYARYEKFGGDL